MPSKSAKQKRTMAAAAHNKAFAKQVGVPLRVAQEFLRVDQKIRADQKKAKKR